MKPIEERMDTFETEELVHNAMMSCGDMDVMRIHMEALGEMAVAKEMSLQSLTYALQDSISAPKMEQIINLAAEYMQRYLNRITTDEMRESLKKEGLGHLSVVLVNEVFANEAIENGRDVFAIKDGEMVLLNKHEDGTRYAEKGYLLAVSPHTYEAEFLNDLDNSVNEE